MGAEFICSAGPIAHRPKVSCQGNGAGRSNVLVRRIDAASIAAVPRFEA